MRPRIRTIKPEAFLDEALWDLELETGFPIFRGFTGLWCHADREGRFEWRPRALKAGILPYWDGDFERVLDALTTRGFLVKYAILGREYGLVRTFKDHQSVNGQESESSLPEPTENSIISLEPHASETCKERVAHATFPSLPFPSSSHSHRGGAGGDEPGHAKLNGHTATPGNAEQPALATPGTNRTNLNSDVLRVFDSWKQDTGKHRAKLDPKRKAKIVARLRDGFTAEDLITAITHRRNDPFLMGQNDSGRVYDDIPTLLRDVPQVERLRDLKEPGRPAPRPGVREPQNAGTDPFGDSI